MRIMRSTSDSTSRSKASTGRARPECRSARRIAIGMETAGGHESWKRARSRETFVADGQRSSAIWRASNYLFAFLHVVHSILRSNSIQQHAQLEFTFQHFEFTQRLEFVDPECQKLKNVAVDGICRNAKRSPVLQTREGDREGR